MLPADLSLCRTVRHKHGFKGPTEMNGVWISTNLILEMVDDSFLKVYLHLKCNKQRKQKLQEDVEKYQCRRVPE